MTFGCNCLRSGRSSLSEAFFEPQLEIGLDEEVFLCQEAAVCKSRCSFNRGGKVGPSLASLLHIYDPKLLWDPARPVRLLVLAIRHLLSGRTNSLSLLATVGRPT